MYSHKKGGLLFLLLICFGMIACKSKVDKRQEHCVYVVADSLRSWLHIKMPDSSRFWQEANDTMKIYFPEDEARKLWAPSFADEKVKELAGNCGFGWQELPSRDGNRSWQLLLPLQKSDTSFVSPDNLMLYLFSK